MNHQEVRVRFAPSPTGPLHIGGVRTALFNYLFARKNKGTFILRIEDTDQNRYVPGAEEYIIESLGWCGITFDEGLRTGGNYGPYRQSDRKEIYFQYVKYLVDKGFAYYAFDTPAEIEVLRERLKEEKSDSQQYDSKTRLSMKNSLTLTDDQVKQYLSSGSPYVIRIKIPENEEIIVHDLIRGDVSFHSSQIDDKVLFKSDGMPTYHLANVVDDHLMKITHVIRGEEWLPSTPLHVLLYRYFDWDDQKPAFAHLPLLLNPAGKGKLSKRDGDKLGFPVFPLQWKDPGTGETFSGYRESGYLSEALVNILAMLGWNPGNDRELFTMDEIIEQFSIEKIVKAGARFDPEKAKWFNHQYILKKSEEELVDYLKDILNKKEIRADDHYVRSVCNLIRERIYLLPDLWNQSHFFFISPETYDPDIIKKKWNTQSGELIARIKQELSATEKLDTETLSQILHHFAESNKISMGQIMIPLRILMVGSLSGPDLFAVMSLLGKEQVIERIEKGLIQII